MPPSHPGPQAWEEEMYNHDGQNLLVIDGNMHFWDANPDNWRNKYGESWIKCFHAYHSSLSPAEEVWPFDKFCRYDEETLANDLFRNGYVDMDILKSKYPDRFLLCGSFDPRDEGAGFDAFRRMMAEYPIQGLKLYTAEWRNGSRGWRLNDPWAYKYLELSLELGIKNIHVHKGPTVYPLSSDAFDVRDVDYAATDFPDLNFIVEHVGLPRLDDFCWIAAQESNVYAGLSVAMAFSRLRPQYFAEIMANLLFWLGPDKLCFGSDYAIWSPKWLIEKFMAFELPDEIKKEYGVDLTPEIKRKILGENAARLYGIDIATQKAKLSQDRIPIGLRWGRWPRQCSADDDQ